MISTPSGATTSLRASSDSAPSLSTRPGVPVTSTIVDGSAPGVGPPSRSTVTDGPSMSSAASASVAAGIPLLFALLTASGPVRDSSSRATSWSGIRTATVPRVSPRSHCREGC